MIVPTPPRFVYTQMLKTRHFGMDAEIQARDGKLTVLRVLHLGKVVRQRLPSLDDGYRHPCRYDGVTY